MGFTLANPWVRVRLHVVAEEFKGKCGYALRSDMAKAVLRSSATDRVPVCMELDGLPKNVLVSLFYGVLNIMVCMLFIPIVILLYI